MLRSPRTILAILCPTLLALAGAGRAAPVQLAAEGRPATVPVGAADSRKDYLLLGDKPVTIPLQGPGEISGYARLHFAPGDSAAKTALLLIAGLGEAPCEIQLDFEAPARGGYGDGREGMPSGGAKFTLPVPPGRHMVKLTGRGSDGSRPFVLLYYDGPAQPWPWHRKIQWDLTAGLTFTYDDNAFGYSDAFMREYLAGWNPEKYKVDRLDDLVIEPRLELSARTDYLDLGTTRLAFRYGRSQFWHNEILANEEYRVALRQNVTKTNSLEFYYSYSPSKYLRQLNDRPPFVSENIPVVSEEFRLTRNNIVGAYRHRFNGTFSGKVQVTRQLYFFNKPHLENDTKSYELRLTLYWKLAAPWNLTLDYAYEDAKGRGIEALGEFLETSAASDGTNKRNFYQAQLAWKPPFRRIVERLTAMARYAVAYYPAEGTIKIEDDPYHVGRQDNEYAYEISAARPLNEKIDMDFGFRYAERDVESPWWGDIKEDKNWIERTYWIGFSTAIF